MKTLLKKSPAEEPEVPRWRQEAFERFSAAVELPMLVLTIVMVPILIAPLALKHLSTGTENALLTIDYFIWAVFAVEYLCV